jgi:hypothetical protein
MTAQHEPALSRRSTLRGLTSVGAATLAAPFIPKAGASDLKTLRIFFPPLDIGWSVGFELIELADARGIFAKNGVRAERAVVPWDQYTVALDTGALDLAPFADYAYFINVYDKGLKAKEIVSSTLPFNPLSHGDGLVVLADGPIKTPQDLKGKRIGTQYPSFSGGWFALDWLTKRGVTKDDVSVVPVPEAQLEQVLKARWCRSDRRLLATRHPIAAKGWLPPAFLSLRHRRSLHHPRWHNGRREVHRRPSRCDTWLRRFHRRGGRLCQCPSGRADQDRCRAWPSGQPIPTGPV